MKKMFKSILLAMAGIVASFVGGAGNALMAVGLGATDTQNGDIANTDNAAQQANGGADGGVATVTQGQQAAGEGGDGLYIRDVDAVVHKIDQMATPLLQISSYASNQDINAQEFEYWAIGPRIGRTTVASNISKAAVNKADRFKLEISTPGFVTKDDTIRVVGYKGFKDGSTSPSTGTVYTGDGKKYTNVQMGDGKEDLILFVINVDEETGYPICVTVNGPANKDCFKLPFDLKQGTVLIRMGKSCGEMDAQTGRFVNYPEPEIQFTQNFMFQVEQSTFDKLTDKKVKWDFNDIEQAGIRDMKIAQENTYLFGKKKRIRHPNKENLNQYFTQGLWWMPSKDLEIGHEEALKWADGSFMYTDEYGNVAFEDGTPFTSATNAVFYDSDKTPYSSTGGGHSTSTTIKTKILTECVVKDDDFVDFAREMFVGAAGNKKKVMLCGSKMLAAFGKVKSDKIALKQTWDNWDLTFSRFHTDFGDVMVIYDEQLDMNGMSAYGFCIDPEYLKKKTFISLKRNVLDLKSAGIRNSDAVTLQEVAGVYLQFADAHARVQLKGNDGALDWETAIKFDYHAIRNRASEVANAKMKYQSGVTGNSDANNNFVPQA